MIRLYLRYCQPRRFPMRNRFLASTSVLALTIIAAAGQGVLPSVVKAPVTGKAAPTAADKAWAPPRTPGGQPDLQGVWTNNTVTPLQRPKELGGKEFYSEEEMVEVQKQQRERL